MCAELVSDATVAYANYNNKIIIQFIRVSNSNVRRLNAAIILWRPFDGLNTLLLPSSFFSWFLLLINSVVKYNYIFFLSLCDVFFFLFDFVGSRWKIAKRKQYTPYTYRHPTMYFNMHVARNESSQLAHAQLRIATDLKRWHCCNVAKVTNPNTRVGNLLYIFYCVRIKYIPSTHYTSSVLHICNVKKLPNT